MSASKRPKSQARKFTLFLFSAAALIASGAPAVHGQSALDGFDPNANGTIRVVVVQPDGKILIGGDFTTVAPNGSGPVARNYIARLNPDGTLDAAFNPNANNSVYAIAVQADGKILAGGDFLSISGGNSIGGQPRNFIARLDGATGAADSFDPNANFRVISIVVQTDGKILAGGQFSTQFGTPTIGGATRNRIARLDPATGLADSFDPNADSDVMTIVAQADGRILVGGVFTSIGGTPRNRVARLDPTTGSADSFNPNASGIVNAIAVQADGKILLGGNFFGANSIGGATTRNRIARVNPTTGAADSFDPNANNNVNAIVVQTDGKILAGGNFTSIGGQTRNRIARIDATTGAADSFDPNANNNVNAIAVQADDKILAGGNFTSTDGQTRNRIARLEPDGRLDQTLNDLSLVGSIGPIAVQPDGKILIGGSFSQVLGVTRNNIARLNSDGTLDTAFDPNANGDLTSIAVGADGKISVGGFFTSIGGQTRNYIARIDSTTGLADSFDPNPNDVVERIVVQADGKILVTGGFSSIGGETRNRIARIDPTTGAADSFDPNSNNGIDAIALQADGKILAAGIFTSIGGQTRHYLARLDATTGLADSFNPDPGNFLNLLTVQGDGKILACGIFNSIGGQPRNIIARLDPTTGLADSFNPDPNNQAKSIAAQADGRILAGGFFTIIGGQMRHSIARLDADTGMADSFDPNASDTVDGIVQQADGKILASGAFSGIGGQLRNQFARLSNDTAAWRNLAVTRSTIIWTRGGSSPQFTRVTFEFSTDNVNYIPLGNGTAVGNTWTLTGLSLLVQQNIYIRARGYYSASLTESVRNAFLAAPTPTPSPTPTVSISGTVLYCSNPVPGPVPNVRLFLTGSASGETVSDGSGNYQFSSLISGGSYTVTPMQSALAPGHTGINTVDVIGTQRHFLNLALLTGCRLTAADVNGDTNVNTVDVIAIQRFFLGFSTGIANVGKYQFSPASRTYSGLVSNQTAQNYNTLIFGDVVSPFADRAGGPLPDAADNDARAGEVAPTVATVSLPEVALDHSVANLVAPVTTTAIDAKNKLVGFQGDFTFDETVVTFQSEPVQKAGLTGGNWNVSGNVLPGKGPIRTLRISAYSEDFTPLSGSGTLFELKMTRVSKAAQVTKLIWAAPPDHFIFIDADLNTQAPGNAASGNLTASTTGK